jgi:hypothetical protein
VVVEPTESIAIIEVDLRHLVEAVMGQVHGPKWHETLLSADVLAKLTARMEEEERRRTPVKVPSAVLAYTHLFELRQIIEKHWDTFSVALGAKKEFMVLMDKVEDFRNAPAHSRQLLPHERSLLEGVAGDIRTRVTVYLSQQSPDAKYYPVIESVRDSFGNTVENSNPRYGGAAHTGLRLQVGQTVEFECRGWDPQDRELTWWYGPSFASMGKSVKGSSTNLAYTIKDEDVGVTFFIEIDLVSDGPYHRHTGYDQRATFHYEVEPPH